MAMLRASFTFWQNPSSRTRRARCFSQALRRGFAAAEQAQKSKGAAALQQKALIFTESRRTQEYLYQILEKTN
jgi:hypothetical protein